MVIVGITGGVASGKSYVARLLQERGAEVLDADSTGHAVLREPDVERRLFDRWGESVRGPDGHIDRRAVATLVFGAGSAAQRERAFLEHVTHPLIRKRLADQLERLRAGGQAGVAVIDAALLWETGWDEYCDVVIFVDAAREVRHARAIERGWSAGELDRREATQNRLAEKRTRADVVIDNSGPAEKTRGQLDRWWHSLNFS